MEPHSSCWMDVADGCHRSLGLLQVFLLEDWGCNYEDADGKEEAVRKRVRTLILYL